MSRDNFRPSLARRINQRSQIIFYRLKLKQKKLIRKLIAINFIKIVSVVNLKLARNFLKKVKNLKKLTDAEKSSVMGFNGLDLFLSVLYYYFIISAIITVVHELFRKIN